MKPASDKLQTVQVSLAYRAVARVLIEHQLGDADLLVHIGEESGGFESHLRGEHGWRGPFLSVNSFVDAVQLENWVPPVGAAFFVAVEVLAHLHSPYTLMAMMTLRARQAVIATVPNPATVERQALGRAYVTPITVEDFQLHGWQAEACAFYWQPEDSILAVFEVG